jgi:chorismate mutase
MERVVRALVHLELPGDAEVRHVYLNGAEELRPDL